MDFCFWFYVHYCKHLVECHQIFAEGKNKFDYVLISFLLIEFQIFLTHALCDLKKLTI